ncbi:MAG: hypothetical protein JXD18_05175 [Anaerolineae bacterium]|nr:hypothetical protein [Anaerolineae bacterium]
MTAELAQLIGGGVGALLALLILSYILLGDNPLYRLALHILVGASVGYAVAVTLVTVLLPEMLRLYRGNTVETVLPILLGLMLMFKVSPRLATLGNFSTAFLIGVGAAVAVGGALLGTILPQSTVSTRGLSGLLLALGTALALLAFNFTVRKQKHSLASGSGTMGILVGFGRVFLVAAFGATFAGAIIASLSVLTGRIYIIADSLQLLIEFFRG